MSAPKRDFDRDRNYLEHWQEWEDFCQEAGLVIVAKIYSDYTGTNYILYK